MRAACCSGDVSAFENRRPRRCRWRIAAGPDATGHECPRDPAGVSFGSRGPDADQAGSGPWLGVWHRQRAARAGFARTARNRGLRGARGRVLRSARQSVSGRLAYAICRQRPAFRAARLGGGARGDGCRPDVETRRPACARLARWLGARVFEGTRAGDGRGARAVGHDGP